VVVFVTAEFRNTSVNLSGRTLIVRTELSNRSQNVWQSEKGWNTGFHLFDEPTGTLVIDGPRTPLDLAAGASCNFETQIPLPPEPGDYSVYVSIMQEHVAWLYSQGWPFILIDVSVSDDGTPTLHSWRVATKSAVRRRQFLRSLQNAFKLPVEIPWRNRGLIGTLVRRDIMSRYAGSFGGALWTLLNPLLLMLTYFFVFGVVLHTKIPGDPTLTGFAFYFLAGMMPWLAFGDALGRAPGILVEHRNFIRKLAFPVETLPVNLVATGLVTEFFGIIIILLGLLILRGHIAPTLVYLPLLVVPQVLLTAGFCWFLAAMGVFVRDLAQINGYLLTIWYFVTPICYSEAQFNVLPKRAVQLAQLNPIYVLVHNYRRILLDATAPDWRSLGWTTAASALICIAGYAWFHKLRKSFADLI
jgi:lipopolysaccharide transport system permease protein